MSKKGSAWERKFCGQLSLWWTDGLCDGVFWRTANSGGRATVRFKKGKNTKSHHGDICAIDPIGEPFLKAFTVELKKGYNSATISDLIDKPNGKSIIGDWITKLEESSQLAGSTSWLLIHHRDRRYPLVIMPATVSNQLNLYPALTIKGIPDCRGLSVCALCDFFRLPPDNVIRLPKRMEPI